MELEAINPATLCEPPEPYSYGIKATGSILFLAGQVALDRDGNIIGSTVREQALQVWRNIRDVLDAAGASIGDIVKVTYYLQDIRELAEEIEVRKQVFSNRPPPAVTAVQAAALGIPGLRMEVDVVAVLSQ